MLKLQIKNAKIKKIQHLKCKNQPLRGSGCRKIQQVKIKMRRLKDVAKGQGDGFAARGDSAF